MIGTVGLVGLYAHRSLLGGLIPSIYRLPDLEPLINSATIYSGFREEIVRLNLRLYIFFVKVEEILSKD